MTTSFVSTEVVSLLATFMVSIVPIGVLLFLPILFQKDKSTRRLHSNIVSGRTFWTEASLNFMLCFAAGSLLADALLHLFVHSVFGDHPSIEHTRKQALVIVFGVTIFFIMDIVSRYAQSLQNSHPPEDKNDLVFSSIQKASPLKAPSQDQVKILSRRHNREFQTIKTLGTGKLNDLLPEQSGPKNCASNGLLSLVADGIHNFTDGLAITAAFSRNFRLGLTATIAIFLHEIPHELGDYAVLIKAGYTHEMAIKLQLLTAAGALLGCISGIAIHSNSVVWLKFVDEDALLPFAAGGFIYIALCIILPEVLLENARSKLSFTQIAGQFLAFIAGILLMVFVE